MSSPNQDNSTLFYVLMNTLQELWVLKDRHMVLERVLQDHGIDVTEAVERLQPDPDLTAKLDAERKRFLETVLEPLGPSDDS